MTLLRWKYEEVTIYIRRSFLVWVILTLLVAAALLKRFS